MKIIGLGIELAQVVGEAIKDMVVCLISYQQIWSEHVDFIH